jgi:hypothetical protein
MNQKGRTEEWLSDSVSYVLWLLSHLNERGVQNLKVETCGAH